MDSNQESYTAMPDLLGTVSWFHADGEYYRTREFYIQTRPLTHHSTHTSIVQKTDEDYANCVEFVKANDYYMTGEPNPVKCPYCDGNGTHSDGVLCGKCQGEGMLDAD